MSSQLKNLSDYHLPEKPDLHTAKIAVIVSSWNKDVTEALYDGCSRTLADLSVKKKNLLRIDVPGSFELPVAAKLLMESKRMDAVICLGCVIQGETRHFDFLRCRCSRHHGTEPSIFYTGHLWSTHHP